METKHIDINAIHERFEYEKRMFTKLFEHELDNVKQASCYFDLKNTMKAICKLKELINLKESSNDIEDMYECIELEEWNSL